MVVESRINKKSTFLVGDVNPQITDANLSFNDQVLAKLF